MGLRPTPRYLQSYSHTSYGQSELRGATSNFCRTSLHLAFVSAGLLTRNFQGIFRKFFYKIVPISSIIKFEPLQISPTRTLVEPYNRISPGQLHLTGLFGISRLSRRATGRGFLDSALSYQQSFLLLQRFLGCFDCDNPSTIPFLSPTRVRPFSRHQGAVHYPQVSLFRFVPSLTSVFLSLNIAFSLH